MALINHAKKEINAKIVYYGPAGSGKSTALTYVYSRIKASLRGELKSVPAGADNLLLFDFSPFETPLPNGYRFKLHIYTLTGIVSNPATWKMTLKGADGIIIMVNQASGHDAETRECIMQLRDFLSAYGVGLHETPAVLQPNCFTKQDQREDLTNIAAELDLSTLATCRCNTANGEGLLEALTTLSRQVLDRVRVREELPEENIINTYASSKPVDADNVLTHSSSIRNTQNTGDLPQVAMLSQAVSEGSTIRIPLEIMQGDALRRLVVTVSVELE